MKKICKLMFLALVLFVPTVWCSVLHANDYPTFSYPKNMDVLIVAEEMVINGIPMQAFQFKTSESEKEVVKFYEKEWGEKMSNVLFGDWRILSHRDGDYLLTVQIEQGGGLITHGTLSTSPLFGMVEGGANKIRKTANKIGKNFLLPNDSQIINDIVSEDGGRTSRTVFFSNSRSVSQNIAFYYSKMVKAKGWSVLPTGNLKPEDTGVLALSKDGSEFNLSFTEKDNITYGVAVSVR